MKSSSSRPSQATTNADVVKMFVKNKARFRSKAGGTIKAIPRKGAPDVTFENGTNGANQEFSSCDISFNGDNIGIEMTVDKRGKAELGAIYHGTKVSHSVPALSPRSVVRENCKAVCDLLESGKSFEEVWGLLKESFKR
jgi:hypothetical protein